MATAAVRGRLTWQTATVTSVLRETEAVRTIWLDVPDWPGHRAGQHLDVRLTAEDGYTAERSYSIATADGEPERDLPTQRGHAEAIEIVYLGDEQKRVVEDTIADADASGHRRATWSPRQHRPGRSGRPSPSTRITPTGTRATSSALTESSRTALTRSASEGPTFSSWQSR
jgi:hypothetical protein